MSEKKVLVNPAHFRQMYNALQRIKSYQTPEQLRKNSERDWGLDYQETIGMAYENIRQEAKDGLKNVRLPKQNISVEPAAPSSINKQP